MTTLGPVVPNQTARHVQPLPESTQDRVRITQWIVRLSSSNWMTFAGLYLLWLFTVLIFTGLWQNPAHWLDAWTQWDAHWYTRIWNEGYGQDPAMLAFPPGYSLLVGSISSLVGTSFAATALCINVPAFFFAGRRFAEFAEHRFGISGPGSFLFFLSAPAAYFALTPYSDPLFLWLFWLALPLAAKDPKLLSSRERIQGILLLLVMPWIRLTAYALSAWVLLRRWFALATAVSLAAWFSLNAVLKGDPLFFLHVQSRFLMADGGFWTGLTRALSQFPPNLRHSGFEWTSWLQFSGLPVLYLALFAGATLWFLRRREWLLALTIVSVTLFSHNQAFWRSVVRYDLVAAPLIGVPLLVWAQNHRRENLWQRGTRRLAVFLFVALTIGGFAFQIYFAERFRAGLWAF